MCWLRLLLDAGRLAREGLREFTEEEVVRVGRQIEAFKEVNAIIAHGYAQGAALLANTQRWKTCLVLASERETFFRKQGMETGGSFAIARAYHNIECELIVDGKHLTVVQKCAMGEDAVFCLTMGEFRRQSDAGRSARWQLRTLSLTPVLLWEESSVHVQGEATGVMREGPPEIEAPLSLNILFVLSNERSGSSLLQLCLQCHSSLYAGQELYLLPFSSLEERGNLLPFEMKEGLLKNVMELRRCSFEDAIEWLDEQEEKRLPIPQVYAVLQELSTLKHSFDDNLLDSKYADALVTASGLTREKNTRALLTFLLKPGLRSN